MKLSLLAIVVSALVGVGGSANDVDPDVEMRLFPDATRSHLDVAMFETDYSGSVRGGFSRHLREQSRKLAFVSPDAACFEAQCTAKEVQLIGVNVSAVNGEGPDPTTGEFTCNEGDAINVTIASLQLNVNPTQGRRDIGIMFNQLGELAGSRPPNTTDCTSFIMNNNEGENQDGDLCGDASTGIATFNINASNPDDPTIDISCTTLSGTDNTLRVSYCTSWNQNTRNDDCPEPKIAIPGTPSKCVCDEVEFNIVVESSAMPSESPSDSPSAAPSFCVEPVCVEVDENVTCPINVPGLLTNLTGVATIPPGACGPVTLVNSQQLIGNGKGCDFDPLVYTNEYTIEDGVGNVYTCPQTYNVINDVAPTFDAPPPVAVDQTCPVLSKPGNRTGTDACDEPLIAVKGCCYRHDFPDLFLDHKWQLTDGCGNVAPPEIVSNLVTSNC